MNSAARVRTGLAPVLQTLTEAHRSATQSREPDVQHGSVAPASRRPAIADGRDWDTPLSLSPLPIERKKPAEASFFPSLFPYHQGEDIPPLATC
jgi:hypothetical protein